MSHHISIGETRRGSFGLSFKRFMLIIKADRTFQILIAVIILATLFIGLSGHFIQPYKSTQTYSDQMYKYRVERNGLNYPNQNLNIYALAPNYPVYITIEDSQHTVLDYQLFFVNDTNLAMGMGPTTLLAQGQISNTTTLVIPHTIYHMTYRLHLDSPGLPQFVNTVTYTQTIFQYPPANYYLLVPGIILALAGIVILGVKIITIGNDREEYLSKLKFKNPNDAYILQEKAGLPRHARIQFPWYAYSLFGVLLCAIGFTIFGTQFILTWIGGALIIAGIVFILNGIVRKLSRRI